MDLGSKSGSSGLGAAARKDIASLLKNSERTVVALLASASQAIVSVERSGRIVLANPRTEEMFGYSQAELLGSNVELLLPESFQEVHAGHRASYFSAPRIRPMGIGMELSGRRKDGTEFPVEVSLSYLETEEGTFAIAFVTDITERKRLEQQFMHAQKMEAVGRLAGGVAHDFNNMLTIISGYGRMLLDELGDQDPRREFAQEVLKAADRAAALTAQLLAFSRRQIMQPRVVEVNALIGSAEKMLRRLIGEDIEVLLALAPDAGGIRADPGYVEQALFNLAVNSRDAMPKGGRITLETCRVYLDEAYARAHAGVKPGEYVMIAVSDTGAGMDAETRSHIFEPFFTTKEKGKGTGLGLATVYGIVKQSGGDIWVYSEPGKGTTFKLYFPRVGDNAEELRPLPEPGRGAGTETILVVEDEPSLCELVATMLTARGYHVLKAGDPEEAARVAARHQGPIAMLLTDVVLPQMSGKELADLLVKSRPELKVLFVSGYTENTVVHHGVLEPGFEFLAKPFTDEALARKVRQILDK